MVETLVSVKEALLTKIDDRTAQVCIVGLGYVGLPLAVEFCRAGFPVTGLDIDKTKCERINAGKSYIGDVPSEAVSEWVEAGRLGATPDSAVLDEADVAVIWCPRR